MNRFIVGLFLGLTLACPCRSQNPDAGHSAARRQELLARAKEIHRRILSLDTHTDTPLQFTDTYNIGSRAKTQVCLPKMEEGCLDGQYLACWVRQDVCDSLHTQEAVRRVNRLLAAIHRQVAMNADRCGIARTADDLARLKAEGKKAFFIGIENAYGVGRDLAQVERVQRQGVTYITLCHSSNNDVCDSSSDKAGPRWGGLSPFGKQLVAEMNRLGVLIDVSHASESTFWDVLRCSSQPVVATHSSSKALYRHNRNLSDEQLRALAQQGGVAQACPLGGFLRRDARNATLADFMKHLLHMIEVAGIDHVGIGTDFDGGGGVKGCNGDDELIHITVALLEAGFSEEEIAKIWGGNFLRVLRQVQGNVPFLIKKQQYE